MNKMDHANLNQKSIKHSILIANIFQQQVCGKRKQTKHAMPSPPVDLIHLLALYGLDFLNTRVNIFKIKYALIDLSSVHSSRFFWNICI